MDTWEGLGIDLRGRNHGEVKTTCPKCSHTRRKKTYPCLNVNVDEGLFHCWHCGWSGSLFKGEEVKSKIIPAKRREYKKPEFVESPLPPQAMEFFTKRGVTADVVVRNHITTQSIYMPQVEGEAMTIAFPFYKNGEVVNVKYRAKDKLFRQASGAEKCFYKYDDISEVTIICEGEMDALSLEVAGFRNAVSVPDGAPAENAAHFETKFEFLDDERLEDVEHFIIAVDNDGPGRRLEDELARRLGYERCSRIVWPDGCKDANEVLVTHGASALKKCIDESQPFPVEGVIEVESVTDRLIQILDHGLPQGKSTGWPEIDRFYTPLEGQWTLVTGIPSMGKSEWLDAMLINMAQQHQWPFAMFSPENLPIDYHVIKLVEKWSGKRYRHMTKEEFLEKLDYINGYFKFIMPEDRSLNSIFKATKALVRRYGIKGLVIDPYNEITHTGRKDGMSETEYISEFLGELRSFARQNGIHIWLVAHPTKLQKNNDGVYPVPTGYDVAGSAHFFNKADNIVAVHRDKSNPDAPSEIHVQKIRNRWLGELGTGYLYWDENSGRYSEMRPSFARAV